MTALLAFPEKTNRIYLGFRESAGVSAAGRFSMISHQKASIAPKATSGRRYAVGTVRRSDEA